MGERTNKQLILPYSGILFSNKKERITGTGNKMNPKNRIWA